MSGFFSNFNDLVKLAQDPDFQKFLANPKVRILMKDPEIRSALEKLGQKHQK